jgi:asparagine synthase (glutamine-hydrolysing)
MCGIAGFVNLDGAPADADVLAAMMDTIRHRGPDDCGALRLSLRGGAPDTALGFHRLIILDRSADARQPMVSPDGSIALLFNGAIYNAFEHRADLERDGYRFRTSTDTEVILALYERLGLDRMLERLNGMFAIVLADTQRGVVHLLRDRIGIKPLYWTQCGATLLFASEAKAFLAHPCFTPEIDPAQVDELLAFRYIAGEETLLKGVRQVPPGHRLTITPTGVTHARYWSIPDPEKLRLSRDEAVDRLDDLLRKSVRSQLRSDVPLGCQLSGGVDSSLVTLVTRSVREQDVDAFSIVVNLPGFSEESWIRAAAATAGVTSHRFAFDEADFMGALDAASWHMDQPVGHPNSLALWLLAQRSKEHATVLLSGEGADELFGGYTRFTAALAAEGPAEARRPTADRVDTFIRATAFHSEARLAKLRPEADLRPALESRRVIFEEGRSDHLSNCLRYDMRTHLVDLLMRQDRMTMGHGVETRVPFLDRDVIEFARALPTEHVVASSSLTGVPSTKIVVKDLAQRFFGAAFTERRKSAFNLPLAQYFRSASFVTLMEDRLLPGMKSRGLVDVEVVRRWWRRALKAPATTEAFWILIALELWAQQFVDGRGLSR